MPGCKVLTRICWFDVSVANVGRRQNILDSVHFYAWQINQPVCRRRETSDYYSFFNQIIACWCEDAISYFHSCKLNFIECQSGLLSPLAYCTHLSDGLVPHQPMNAQYSSYWPITVQGWEAPSLEWWRGRWMGDRSEAISGWQCCYSQLFPPHIAHCWDEAPAPQWCKHSVQAWSSARCWWHY